MIASSIPNDDNPCVDGASGEKETSDGGVGELTEDSSGRIVTGETGLAHTRSRGGQYMNTRDILQALAWSWDREGGNNRSVWPERQEVHQRSFWPAQQTRRARQEHNKQHTHCQ